MTNKKGIFTSILCSFLIGAIFINITGCALKVQASDLMEGVNANTVIGKASDDRFIKSSADFAVKLFKETIAEDKSSLISPLSVMLALAMTANGADTKTKKEMETLLGGDTKLEKLNEYLYTYVKNLPSDKKYKLEIANSIWFRNDENRLTVEKDFLQKNADYYGANAYKSPFDAQTLKDINNWVEDKTDGMIDKIIDEINPDAVMYLINAIVFDAEWQNVYKKNDIYTGTFTAYDGTKRSVEMMISEESKYIDDGKATGFIKDYKDGKYSFVALLPNEDISINDYIASLSGEGLIKAIKNSEDAYVEAQLPKFSYDYTVSMNDALKTLGMPTAFNTGTADFSKLGKSARGNIYIGEVLHKTFISVDELGTKAGAVTKVEMRDESARLGYTVKLDRPFVYMIIDNETKLPIFIGTVMDIKK